MDMVAYHSSGFQADRRSIEAAARILGMSMDRVVLTIESQGNTSVASVSLVLGTDTGLMATFRLGV